MRVLLGMSGGFDSTYAALKLREMGYDVEGAVLVMHDHTDVKKAEESAERLGIKLHKVDCREIFASVVEKNFIEEYKNARTPNPCIICNREVKFKVLLDYALSCGFDRIATGHYAKIDKRCGRYTLVPPMDTKKDQSYMLSRLDQRTLEHLVFPLCDEVKSELRERAVKENLPLPTDKDSQEICFIPEGRYPEYIKEHIGDTPCGNFIDTKGNVLGRHRGIINYTVGQRKGLGIALGRRVFVSKIDPVNNTVTLADEADTRSRVELFGVVCMGIDMPVCECKMRVKAKIRYQASPEKADLYLRPDGTATLVFDAPVRSATPGQTAVMYLDDAVLASGFIGS